jgi:hypothetical protein
MRFGNGAMVLAGLAAAMALSGCDSFLVKDPPPTPAPLASPAFSSMFLQDAPDPPPPIRTGY